MRRAMGDDDPYISVQQAEARLPAMEPMTEEELRMAQSMMRFDGFEKKYPRAAGELARMAGGREKVLSILPDDDCHCEWSALCEDQPVAMSMHQIAGRRDRVAVYVRSSHPYFEEHPTASPWVWEDEL
jgi:hypothetical protein